METMNIAYQQKFTTGKIQKLCMHIEQSIDKVQICLLEMLAFASIMQYILY